MSKDFETPLQLLASCHRRIEGQCATLKRLVPHLAAKGADSEARAAAAAVMRYFDTSGMQHHEDEERDLFPALIESMAGSDAVCLRELTEGLKADHRALQARWERIRAVLERVVEGVSAPLAAEDVEALAGLYERHIAREEDELLPMAARLLTDEELARIGDTMLARRELRS